MALTNRDLGIIFMTMGFRKAAGVEANLRHSGPDCKSQISAGGLPFPTAVAGGEAAKSAVKHA